LRGGGGWNRGELSHPFVNAWVHAHTKELEPGGRALFDVVRERMTANANGDWASMLDESMARASALRYFADHHDSAFVRTNVLRDREQGFLWTDELSRAMSPPGVSDLRLAAASPSLLAYVDARRREPAARLRDLRASIERDESARRAVGPQLRLTPADGDTAVAAGPALLELSFDRPRSGRTMILGRMPELTGPPVWDEEKRVLRVPVRLIAGTSVRLQLNDPHDPAAGFVSRAGEPLYPRTWIFRVP
jgi:hypothetical protein